MTLAPQARQERPSDEILNYSLSRYSDILSMIIAPTLCWTRDFKRVDWRVSSCYSGRIYWYSNLLFLKWRMWGAVSTVHSLIYFYNQFGPLEEKGELGRTFTIQYSPYLLSTIAILHHTVILLWMGAAVSWIIFKELSIVDINGHHEPQSMRIKFQASNCYWFWQILSSFLFWLRQQP